MTEYVVALNNSGYLLDEHADCVNRYTASPLPPCENCGQARQRNRNEGRGLCARCYRRWQAHGFAGYGPPDPLPGCNDTGWQVRDPYVLADFARLDNPSIPGRTAELCRRFGVTRRTLTRWRGRLARDRRRRELLALAVSSCGRARWRKRLRPGAIRRGSPDVGPVAALVAAEAHDQRTRSADRVAHHRA